MKSLQLKIILFTSLWAFLSLGIADARFQDVPSDSEFSTAINYIKSQAIVEGYEDGTFRPNNEINRAEFIKIVTEAQLKKETIQKCIAQNIKSDFKFTFFSDVPVGEWFAPHVCISKMNGIINGYSDGTFRPNQTISFVEAAKIIVGIFGLPVVKDEENWYKPYLEKLAEKKAIPSSLQSLDEIITRGEMAEMIYRLKAGVTSKESKVYADFVSPPEAQRENSLEENAESDTTLSSPASMSEVSSESLPLSEGEPLPANVTPEAQNTSETANKIHEYSLIAKNWEFVPSTITVSKGQKVRIYITSIDVTHGFALPEYGVNKNLVTGETVTAEFIADKVGEFPFFCSVFCGSGHANMKGTLLVTEEKLMSEK